MSAIGLAIVVALAGRERTEILNYPSGDREKNKSLLTLRLCLTSFRPIPAEQQRLVCNQETFRETAGRKKYIENQSKPVPGRRIDDSPVKAGFARVSGYAFANFNPYSLVAAIEIDMPSGGDEASRYSTNDFFAVFFLGVFYFALR